MKCDELKLFSYLEGISTDAERSEIEEHLRGCKKCREELEQLTSTIQAFTQFYAHQGKRTCPSGEELISFKYGMLDQESASEIRRHVDQCADCQEQLKFLECFEKEEHAISHEPIDPPPLSQEILAGIEQLKNKSIRDRMEKALRSVVDKGKDALQADKIRELLDQVFAPAPATSAAFAIPSDATLSDTELTLREFSLLTDVTIDVGEYRICLKLSVNSLTVSIHRAKRAVSDVEITVKTKSRGEFKGRTDSDGACIIEGVPPGPYHLKIRMPGENRQ